MQHGGRLTIPEQNEIEAFNQTIYVLYSVFSVPLNRVLFLRSSVRTCIFVQYLSSWVELTPNVEYLPTRKKLRKNGNILCLGLYLWEYFMFTVVLQVHLHFIKSVKIGYRLSLYQLTALCILIS